jgi:AcrR family transcriptional regulator
MNATAIRLAFKPKTGACQDADLAQEDFSRESTTSKKREPSNSRRLQRRECVARSRVWPSRFSLNTAARCRKRELTAEASVNRTLLYRHFSTKDVIIEKVYADISSLTGLRTEIWIRRPHRSAARFSGALLQGLPRASRSRAGGGSGSLFRSGRHHRGDPPPVETAVAQRGTQECDRSRTLPGLYRLDIHIGLRKFLFRINFLEDMEDIIADKILGFLNAATAATSATSRKDATLERLPDH